MRSSSPTALVMYELSAPRMECAEELSVDYDGCVISPERRISELWMAVRLRRDVYLAVV